MRSGQFVPVRPVALLAGRVLEATARLLDREQPLKPPPRLVQQVWHTVPGLWDAGIVLLRREIGSSREHPEERRIGRGAVDRKVAGVVPALDDTGRRQGGVAGVDPGALGVLCIDLGEGALVVEGPLHGADDRVEHAAALCRRGALESPLSAMMR